MKIRRDTTEKPLWQGSFLRFFTLYVLFFRLMLWQNVKFVYICDEIKQKLQFN